ncbi:MAG TPA: hypothetical protein VLA49_06025 [Anaerolineales bacterium]|nr:hypothetical protein [Anaerolineales bacterium]
MLDIGNIVIGQGKKWQLLKKLGEGDAGEVYLVESLLEGKTAILKRPRVSAFLSDVLRQASQITTEGKILKALSGITFPKGEIRLATPALLDQSPAESGVGERVFIVIEQATGYDLLSLLRLARSGLVEDKPISSGAEHMFFVQTLAEIGKIPEPILVRSLLGLIDLLEKIHSAEIWNDGVKQHGVLWNDVKPEHLYWDPLRTCLTVIDWGNGNFLEADGASKDGQRSSIVDYHQFLLAMGAFLSDSNPELHERLAWPQDIAPANAYARGVKPLRKRLLAVQKEQANHMKALRTAESRLYTDLRPSLDYLSQCDELQRQIVSLGEMPDFIGAVNMHARVAMNLAAENRLEDFQRVCQKTAQLATSSTEKWELLADIAGIAIRQNAEQQNAEQQNAEQQNADRRGRSVDSISGALSAGIADDWPTLLWDLFEGHRDRSLPDWWDSVSQGVRRVHLKLEGNALTPDVVVSRLFYTLQTAILQMGDKDHARMAGEKKGSSQELLAHEDLLRIFEEEVVKKWKEVEPAPPNSGIGYTDIDGLMEEVQAILPDAREKLEKALAQPKAQSEIVLSAWERKDFETARQALRRLLLWDPYRRRLLQADRALEQAPRWLLAVRKGAGKDEPFYDFLTSIELAGRSLRNRVGGARWLDLILESLKRLRKGVGPVDLIMENPEIANEIPWLHEFQSREILTLPRSRPLTLERDRLAPERVKTVTGVVEGRLGLDLDLRLGGPLDTWVSEAHGSSARVFAGEMRGQAGKLLSLAIKIMRPDRLEYALPLFKEEAHILALLRDVPGVTPLVECGFMRLEKDMHLPGDESQATAAHLSGELVRYGAEDVQNFLTSMEGRLAGGWLPYLALVKRDHQYNLMKYCDVGYSHGWFLPLRESLLLGIQICDILQIAHDRNIAYRDHKILHFYWDPASHGVVTIDWNIAKRHSEGISDSERQFDLVQFGARALHHILTGRPAIGALPVGPNRPEEIENASLSYPVNWTYDDERLPLRLKEILEQVLNQGYAQVKDLRADLVQVYEQATSVVQVAGNSNH